MAAGASGAAAEGNYEDMAKNFMKTLLVHAIRDVNGIADVPSGNQSSQTAKRKSDPETQSAAKRPALA